ncbi:YkvA family protein [Ectobacillus sp. sgz5001026]|uniref:YkvA family protein n=1 Tax=Ectobacillus sp. sgz5001026 TaxID=3242473 RepID=UPI0036D2DE65
MEQKFSKEAFWIKVKQVAVQAGAMVIYSGLLLYYVLQKPDLPKRYKVIIIGALAYFIAPIDVIPDMLAGVGYTDDVAVLGTALMQVAMHIDEDVKKKAKEKLQSWFQDTDTSSIDNRLPIGK